jgi:hypothetical protein
MIGPGPAAFFRDACRLMDLRSGVSLVATTHLVSHLLRDLESALRDVLETIAERSERARCGKGGTGHADEIRSICKALGIEESDPVAVAWLLHAPGDTGLHKRAHRDALERPRPVDDAFLAFWDEIQVILDRVLDRFETRYLDYRAQVEKLVTKDEPTSADLKLIRDHLPNNVLTRGEFFDRLTSWRWLELLAKEGFFSDPPGPENDSAAGTISYPAWPPSRYLARIANIPEAQEAVLRVALAVPETDNIRVSADLADVALALPAALAALFVPKAKKWSESSHSILLPDRIAAIVGHLTRGGKIDEALEIARALLTVVPGRERVGTPFRPEPESRFDVWHYRKFLSEQAPELVDEAGERALEVFSALLESALELSRRPEEKGSFEDASSIWRRAIEDHIQNHDQSVKDALVSAVRDATLRLAARDPTRIEALVNQLEGRRWRVFQRLALYLLSQHAASHPLLVESRLANRALFEDTQLRHEYYLLSQAGFGVLPAPAQAAILFWIEKGPDLESAAASSEAILGRRPSDVELGRYAKSWRRDRLEPLKAHLGPPWREQYDALVAELGPADHPEFTSYTSTWSGPTSPRSANELRSMEPEAIAAYVHSWKPSRDWMAPTREGLGRELTGLVAADPARFAVRAVAFRGTAPTYVHHVLQGFIDGLRERRPFDWTGVLDLCEWVVHQPHETSIPSERSFDDDPDWSATKQVIAELLSRGLDGGVAELPITLRERVWALLRPLTDDPNPTLEEEAKYGPPNLSAVDYSLGTVRGQAMRAIMRYALWVQRALAPEATPRPGADEALDRMPEVRDVLERHLDCGLEKSLAVRSVYGQWFAALVFLGRRWVESHLEEIFPTDSNLSVFRDAAWDAYLTWSVSEIMDATFAAARSEYDRAVQRVHVVAAKGARDDSRLQLGEHLVTFYWRGKLDLEPGGMLETFLKNAPDTIVASAIDFVGQSLEATPSEIPVSIVDRLKTLWKKCTSVSAEDPGSHVETLAAFGSWFTSRKLDDDWAMAELLQVVRQIRRVDPDHLVVEVLAKVAPRHRADALKCLSELIAGAIDDWTIYAWREHARAILSEALRNESGAVVDLARDTINRLAARGFPEFGDLL